MKKAAPLLVLLLLAIAGAYFLLARPPEKAPRPEDPPDEAPTDGTPAPTALTAAPGGGRPKHDPTRIVDEAPSEPAGTSTADGPALVGVVVDAATGSAVAGARVSPETAATPCPAPLRRPHPFIDGDSATIENGDGSKTTGFGRPIVTTDREGRFRIPWADPGAADVYVKAAGYVLACACHASAGAEVTVRLDRGLSIEGVVVTRDDKGVAGARVTTKASSPAASGLGHDEFAMTDAEGRFKVTGLVEGSVVVRADAGPAFMPAVSESMNPGRRDVRLVVVPAFVVMFDLKTDDGRDPESPTVGWTTTGSPPRTGLALMQPADVMKVYENAGPGAAPRSAGISFGPVRLAADRPSVRFEVKALGYSTWTSDAIEIPDEGGSTRVAVELRRDPNLGRLIARFEDRDGKPLSFVTEQVEPSIWRRDAQAVTAGIVLQRSETLELPALPSGPYGLLFHAPGHAPALVEKVDVAAGRDTEVRVVLGPPAKVRVRFTAPERTMVRFRVMLGREQAYAVPDRPANAPPPDPSKAPPTDGTLEAEPEGVVLSGLSTGRYTIEVLSPELTAPPTSVDLVEGDTKEIEIAVSKK